MILLFIIHNHKYENHTAVFSKKLRIIFCIRINLPI